MRYRNKLTGIEMDFKSPVSGKNWEPVKAPVPVPKEPDNKPEKVVKNGRNRKSKLRDSE